MNALNLTAANFEEEVLKSTTTVLVDFWAAWCGPCKMIAPILEEVAKDVTDVKICKVNVDDEGALAQKYGVTTIPTLIVFKDGKIINQSAGLKNKNAIIAMLK